MSSANRSRKYDSAAKSVKRNKDDLTQSQKGATDRFIAKESQVSSNNEILDQSPAL